MRFSGRIRKFKTKTDSNGSNKLFDQVIIRTKTEGG